MCDDDTNLASGMPSVIKGVIAQKTLMIVCKKCNEIIINEVDNNICPSCGDKLNTSNISIFEVLQLKDKFLSMLCQKDNYQQFKEALAIEKGSYANSISGLLKNLVQ
jgi:type II secretory ATPase GspE/PulE/Tfp pilus assembly ATPase PilB-like protein